ncbi:MAG: PIN domain-containing protein [Paracoccaceae bacterium]
MPIVTEVEIKSLLAEGRISAVTLDTSIFDQKQLQLNSAPMQALASLKEKPFNFLLSGTVAKEVFAHLEKAAEEALRAAKKSIGQALFSFETEEPSRAEILQQISGGRTAAEAAYERWEKYVDDTGCEVLDDTELVDISTVYNGYFAGEPPFGTGRKKDEFPDALALHALERAAALRGIGILVVSKDGDWRAFCEQSQRLYIVSQVERALDLITNAPIGLRETIHAWLANEGEGREQVQHSLSTDVEHLEFTANAHPTHGEVEISTWAGELKSIEWPNEADIDIIEVDELDEGETLSVVVSLPVDLRVSVLVELSFSFWDSVDKESIGMGGRAVDVEEEIYVRASLTLNVYKFGTEDQEIEFDEGEIEDRFHELELGEVDVFEPEDYWDGGEGL